MKNLLSFCFLLILSFTSIAQNITQAVLWNYNDLFPTFGVGDQISDSEGSTYHIGLIYNGIPTDANPSIDTFYFRSSAGGSYILKLDRNGEFVWAKGFEGNSRIEDLDIHNDSVYVIGRFSDSLDLNPDTTKNMRYAAAGGRPGGFYLVLDKQGNFVNGDAIPVTSQSRLTLRKLKISSDGSVNIVGTFQGSIDFNTHPIDSSIQRSNNTTNFAIQTEFFFLKLNPDLTFNFVEHWTNASISAGGRTPLEIMLDDLDNLYISATVTSPVDIDPGSGVAMIGFGPSNGNSPNSFLAKFSPTGTFQWVRSFQKMSQSYIYNRADIGRTVIAPNNKIYYAGLFADSIDFDPGPGVDLRVANKYGVYIAQFELNGQLNWVRTLNSGNSRNNSFNGQIANVTADASSNLYFSIGQTDTLDFDYTSGTAVYTNLGTSIFKTDANGNFQWIKEFPGARTIDHLSFVGNDSVYICGKFRDTVKIYTGIDTITLFRGNVYNRDESFIIKSLAGPGTITALDEPFAKEANNFIAYPNPTNGILTIQSSQANLKQIFIRNNLGQLVEEKQVEGLPSYTLTINGKSGLYFIDLISKSGERNTIKVIKQ